MNTAAMPSFRWQGQDWELPSISSETLFKIRPSVFISYFFAIESNKRDPASSSNKHFLTEAYKTVLERKLGLKAGDDEMQRALHRWKEDKYWTVGHGEQGDSFSTKANPSSLLIPNSQVSLKGAPYGPNDVTEDTPEKQLECFFWRRDGFCRFSEEDCLYAHHPTGKIKEYIELKDKAGNYKTFNHTAAAPQVKKMECYFWSQGVCKFSEEECKYAHYRVYDDPNRSDIGLGRRERRFDSPEPINRYDNTDDISSKQLECYFWRRDNFCKFTEEACLYAHHPTGKVKEIPGQPRIIDYDSSLSDLKRLSDQHPDKTSREWAMPKPPSQKLSELTLSAFFDLFCYTNPAARKDRPWEIVLTMYKTYITRNFGKEALRHVLAAYARTKLPIPSHLLEKYTLQLDDELSKKAVPIPPANPDKNGDVARVTAPKRTRSVEEKAVMTTPKRMKSERDRVTPPKSQERPSESIQESHGKSGGDIQKTSMEGPTQRSTRLYSPSMPYLATSQPNFNGENVCSTPARHDAPVPDNTISVTAKSVGNRTKEVARPPRPYAASLNGTASGPLSPARSSQRNDGSSREVVMNGTTLTATHKKVISSKDPGLSSTKYSIPETLLSATLSPPDSMKSVAPIAAACTSLNSEQIRQISPEVSLQSTSSSYNAHVDDHPSIAAVQERRPESLAVSSTQTAHNERPDILKGLSNGFHTAPPPTSSLSSKVFTSKGPEFESSQPSQLRRTQQEHVSDGNTYANNMLSASVPAASSSTKIDIYSYAQPNDEPLGAHVVRLEALLKGALMELETLKRAVK